MKHWFFAAALLCVSSVAHAALMPTYDMDELLFSSESVIEGPIVAVHTRNYERSADVRVERTWQGQNIGQVVTVGDLGLYSISRSPERTTDFKRGDHAIFFLQHPPSDLLSLPKEKWWALASGVRLVRSGRVLGFTQIRNPGGYDELPAVSRAVFDAGFAASRARIADLKRHLHAPVRLEDKPYFERWKAARRQALSKSRFGRFGDVISQAIEKRLDQVARTQPKIGES